ncbi:maf protein [Delftia acidovorans SPH-1]|uniref:7-methyl-GTP pyrophosphatase n=1 Tax=Delftia acidovorans (strain DSM 14801 / SPH-1) TaxID=398578 RepID=A9BNL0_DELAS|nr:MULTISPECIES: Maf family nucleotide pyrophosphatase [Delftia]MBA4005405.1 septum formation inhibitor Maf [Delftia sp.]ABX37905.1 maf protein [Delftia acidovorans SPH-1]MCP4017475.1 septum formation inhibitor Maf [Delftia sp.]MCP4517950.1 septum formation inhibitor Maf [Delftia sp.]MCP4533087.1 septum formation inhibitor Maf [Delftia sp.]
MQAPHPALAQAPGLARPLILGSTSRYRRELLERLRLPFQTVSPEVDETPLAGETPHALSLRLALAKAQAVAALHPGAVVIGSDQVPELDGLPLSKPGNHERATEQLRQMSGRQMNFHTAVSVVCQEIGFSETDVVTVQVRFRDLNDAEIERYLRAEQPYDCAGSAKSEGLGIALLDAIVSDDPTALIGLPLIRTCQLLRAAGAVLP